MGRRPRLEYEGAIYHVIQRGNNREDIFEDDIDKEMIINSIHNYLEVMKYSVYGYVIMSNHYHLLIRTTDIPLCKIMHRINGYYSKYYNKKKNRSGHVFGDRYKAIPVLDEAYLLTLIRYIHQNPVRARICSSAQEYGWSSDFFYRYEVQGKLDIDFVFNLFSPDRVKARRLYEEFVNVPETENYDDKTTIGEMVKPSVAAPTMSKLKKLDDILIQTGVSLDNFKLIKTGSRKRELTPYKIMYVKKALNLNYSLKEIGDNINISDAAVFKLVSAKIN